MFLIASAVAVAATVGVITHVHAVHALLYLVVSFMAVALIFYQLGAPFVSALEVIIYAGAIMVLFVFVVMMLNQGPRTIEQEQRWLSARMWIGPAVLSSILLVQLLWLVLAGERTQGAVGIVHAKQVSVSLYGPYLIGVELASMLLLPGLIGAYHLGRRMYREGTWPGTR
jgi:NADH-quinone oxidoreductase subunit J